MKKAILMGVPHHNNLGDNAIAIAEEKYIKENFNQYQYHKLSEETLERCIEKVTKHIDKEDLIFLHGGGNFGDEYLYVEEARRKVIQLLPNNRIIMFPQTIYFSDTEKGKKELLRSKEIYSKHKNLTILAREKISYEIIKKEFPNNRVIQTPDIVTYLKETNNNQKREGLLFMIRNDREAKLSNKEIEEVKEIAEKYFTKIEWNDTARGEGILEKNREKKLHELLEKYKRAKLVITDRLHGMIFAAITSTPCIALDNYNHKVKASSETLATCKYIIYTDQINKIEEKIDYLLNTHFEEYDNTFAIQAFKKITQGGR